MPGIVFSLMTMKQRHSGGESGPDPEVTHTVNSVAVSEKPLGPFERLLFNLQQ